MRSIEEQMMEIRRRKSVYAEKKNIHRITGLATGLCLLLIGALLFAPGVTGKTGADELSFYGATILGPEAGGYVIVAILAFILGILTTVLIQRMKKLNNVNRKAVEL